MTDKRSCPIGVFDSGVGGISVLKELRRLMPAENFLFFGDNQNAPYGTKSPEEVLSLVRAGVDRLLAQSAKEIVLACNTATAVAADEIRREHPGFPIVAIEPAIKPAAETCRGKKVLLMATPLTLQTDRVSRLSRRFENAAQIEVLPCDGLVELIEAGHLDDEVLDAFLQELFARLTQKPDAVVLGCTHYPHVLPALRRYFGSAAEFFGGGVGCARRARDLLAQSGLLRDGTASGSVTFSFSADSAATRTLADRLLNSNT